MTDQTLSLEIVDVVKRYHQRSARGSRNITAVNEVSVQVHEGESVALVGESGCGKSTLARMAVGLEKPTEGTVRVLGKDLSKLRKGQLRKHRKALSMVFQDPASSMNPRWSIQRVVTEPLRVHGMRNRRTLRARAAELLAEVGLDEGYLDRRPAQLSGGQKQRVGIARALALSPKLLVLDEAVSALDVSVQAQVLNVLKDVKERHGLSYLFISHDLSVVRHIAGRLVVMYLGQVVEEGPAESVFEAPQHPYTLALLSAVPPDNPGEVRERNFTVGGELPDPAHPPKGCPFASRCWKAQDVCVSERPEHTAKPDGGVVACHFPLSTEELS